MSQQSSWDDIEEESGFAEEMPEDFYAAEELILGALSKCRKRGGKKKTKTFDKATSRAGQRGSR